MREQTRKEMTKSRSHAFNEAPRIIKVSMLFPYIEGYSLATREKFTLLEHPPASTEQVLHGDRRHELFLAIDLSRAEAALPRGCETIHMNTVGELGLSVLFEELGGNVDPEAWIGWDGDRLLAARCGETVEFAWLTAWDSDRDAREFEAAYRGIRNRVAERAGHPSPPSTRRGGRDVVIHTAGLAALAEQLDALARRARVGTAEELLEHFAARPRSERSTTDAIPTHMRTTR